MTDPTPYLFGIKVSTMFASAIMAVLAVLLDIRRHSIWTGLLAVAAGMGAAVIFTDPITGLLGWPDTNSHAIAGVLGISGRNIIIWIVAVSKDPLALWDRFRGKK